MASNCPMYPEYYDPQAPIRHGKPVHHSGIQVRVQDYPDRCLWDQLKWAREEADRGTRDADDKFLLNLETEWDHRNLCSQCLRELDHPFMTEVDSLRHARDVAEGKLKRINGALRQLGEAELRKTLTAILDSP
jgi:hypothetical protein